MNMRLGRQRNASFTHTHTHTHSSRMHDVTRPHAPNFVFVRGVTRQCHKTVHVGKPVHRSRCQRRWLGPLHTVPWSTTPVHGIGTPHIDRSGEAAGNGTTGTSLPAMRVTTPPTPSPNAATVVTYHRHVLHAHTHTHSPFTEKVYFTTP